MLSSKWWKSRGTAESDDSSSQVFWTSKDLPLSQETKNDVGMGSSSNLSSGFHEKSMDQYSTSTSMVDSLFWDDDDTEFEDHEQMIVDDSVLDTNKDKSEWIHNLKMCFDRGDDIPKLASELLWISATMLRSCDATRLASDCHISTDDLSILSTLLEHTANSLETENLTVDLKEKFRRHSTSSIKNVSFSSTSLPLQQADMSTHGRKDSYSVSPRILPPTAKKRRLEQAEAEKPSNPPTPFPDIGISFSALTYMAIVNHPDKKCLSVDISKFVLYLFPVLKKHELQLTRKLSTRRGNCSWIFSTKFDNSQCLWSIKTVPSQLKKWKYKCFPKGLREGVEYSDLIRGKLKLSFDLDGNLVDPSTEDNIVPLDDTHSLCDILEQLIKSKNNLISTKALEQLMTENYPLVVAKHGNYSNFFTQDLPMRPWIVYGEKVNGRKAHLLSVIEEKKGLPLLSREADVPPVIFRITKRAQDYKILDNDGGTCWHFFEIENGKEVTEENTENKANMIHVRLSDTRAKYKTFVSWFTKKDKDKDENSYALNFGTGQSKYVTTSHAYNMRNVESRMDAELKGQVKLTSACAGPRELYNEDDDYHDDDSIDLNLWNTNYWDALGLFTASSYRVMKRVRDMLRQLYVSIGKDRGYHPNWSEDALRVLTSLPFVPDINYKPPGASDVR